MNKWQRFCGWALRKWGWTVDGEVPSARIAVVLAVPHTSIWDFLVCYLFYTSYGVPTHSLVKKEMFKWPVVGKLLKAMGAIPLDRKNPVFAIKGTIDKMKTTDAIFHIAISPEGTRKPVKRWKTGYHTIAKALDCPVILGVIDWGTRTIGCRGYFPLTDDARKDTENLQKWYENLAPKGKHPEKFLTH